MTKKTHQDFKFIRLIGEGSFSSVYAAVDASASSIVPSVSVKQASVVNNNTRTTPGGTCTPVSGHLQHEPRPCKPNGGSSVRIYAIKVCQKNHIKRERKHKAIMREKEIMNVLNVHPNKHFIRLYCTFQDRDRLFFVMTYAQNGELSAFIRALKTLPKTTTQFYTLQILSALHHMHRLGITHRDLKPDNLLLDANMNILVTDFGSAQYKPPTVVTNNNNNNSNHKTSTSPSNAHTTLTPRPPDADSAGVPSQNLDRRNSFVGSAQYVSPEVLQSRTATNMSDLWALGVIVYQMLSGQLPFNAPNEYHVFKRIVNLDYDDYDFEPSARHFIESLLKLEPSERLGATDKPDSGHGYESVRRHEFLTPADGHDAEITIGRQHIIERLNDLGDKAPAHWRAFKDDDRHLLDGLDKIEPGLNESQLLRLMAL